MIYTVGFHRLDLIKLGKDQTGKRKYLKYNVKDQELLSIKQAVLHGLGLSEFLN